MKILLRVFRFIVVLNIFCIFKASGHVELSQYTYAPIVELAAPAVVNIYTEKVVERVDTLFPGFWGEFLGTLPTRSLQKSLGSGVIVRPNGIIITNAHVVKGGTKIRVVLSDEEELDADVIVEDTNLDLAALKLRVKNRVFPYLKIAPYDQLRVGDIVLAIGCPRGLRHTVTGGLISGLGRTEIKKNDYRHLIQVDTALARGSSGGAIVIMTKHGPMLAAIATAILSDYQGAPAGFGIPGIFIEPILRAVDNGGKLEPVYDGIVAQNITHEIRKALKLEDKVQGILIREIYPNSPAAKADIQRGDVLISIADRSVRNVAAHQFRLSVAEPKKIYKYTIFRNGQEFSRDIMIDIIPSQTTKPFFITEGDFLSGITVQELSPYLNYSLSRDLMDTGIIIVDIEKNSRAFLVGFRPHDLIRKINNKKIENLHDLQEALRGGISKLEIQRGDQNIRLMVG